MYKIFTIYQADAWASTASIEKHRTAISAKDLPGCFCLYSITTYTKELSLDCFLLSFTH